MPVSSRMLIATLALHWKCQVHLLLGSTMNHVHHLIFIVKNLNRRWEQIQILLS